MINPFLMCFPYLPVQRSYVLGPWRVVPASGYTGPWLSKQFEDRSHAFLKAFRDANGKPFKDVYLLVHGTRGADGKRPTRPAINAIQSAMNFAVLDRNPAPGSDNAGWGTATTDNSELFIWPIDVAEGRVSLGRGSIVPVLDGGHQITDALTVPAPLELHMPFAFTLDQEMLTAIYQLGSRRFSEGEAAIRRRLEVAIDWLGQAWRNSPSLRPSHRIVFLKTGIEALTDTSDSWQAAKRLRRLFESELGNESGIAVDELLWSPKETERHAIRVKKVIHQVTDLQDWLMAFSRARNTIIHDGLTPNLMYRRPSSRYNGYMVYTAERLLRESIKVSMGTLGFADLWRTRLARAILKAIP